MRYYRSIITALVVLISPTLTFAAKSHSSPVFTWVYDNMLFVIGAIVLVGGLITIWHTLNGMLTQQVRSYDEQLGRESHRSKESWLRRTYTKALGMVPVEQENDIVLGHDYDGIRELDNSLPPWWVYLFYFTILFGAGYSYIYLFSDIGQNQYQEYESEMKIAEVKKSRFLYEQANAVNETNVALLTAADDIAAGQKIFNNLCSSCHGKQGEGVVGLGPNMTDDYYLHGGGIKNVFRTVKYGVPEKGMISWQSQLQPSSMQKVASYIVSLRGKNVPNGKAPEGELYKEETE